ncbi:putative DNA recombinase [Sporomusaceae bacterium FL31]|nr:putative DNA recombinase [Sporomusaceae bacterium FL31]GCE35915.1 putative DNA recombinase [Sporomusaceae bacterium]
MNAIYVRVSTEEQAQSGYSLEDQLKACHNRLLAMGLSDTCEYIDDGYSGEFIDRPALDRLRNDLNTGLIQSIVIYDPDRMSRNLTVQLVLASEFEKAGAKLYFVTGDYDASPEGRLFFNMKGAVSAYEKEKIRERTSRGRRAKAQKGKIVLNSHPFGYDWDAENSMYIVNQEEAAIVRQIYELCLTNSWGARMISLDLAKQGIKGYNNQPLSLSTVSRILSKEMYYGQHYLFRQRVRKIAQNKRDIKNNPPELWIPVKIPAIVSHTTWLAVQDQLQRNKKVAKRNTKHNYLLRGVLCCALCGRSMTAYSRPGKRKQGEEKLYRYYSCISKESNSYAISGHRCQCRRIPVEELEEAVWESLVDIACDQKFLDAYFNKHHAPDYSAELSSITQTQESLLSKRDEITKWYCSNLIDNVTAEKELRLIQKDLEANKAAKLACQEAFDKIKKPALLPTDILKATTFQEKRKIILSFQYQIHAVRLTDHFEFWFKE